MKAKVKIASVKKKPATGKPADEKEPKKLAGTSTDIDDDDDEEDDDENDSEVAKIKDRAGSGGSSSDDADDEDDDSDDEEPEEEEKAPARKASVKPKVGDDYVEIAMTRTIRAPRIGNHAVNEIIGAETMVQGEAYMVPRDVAIVLRDKKAAIGGR